MNSNDADRPDPDDDDSQASGPAVPASSADPGLVAVPECASGVLVAIVLAFLVAGASWLGFRWRRKRAKKVS